MHNALYECKFSYFFPMTTPFGCVFHIGEHVRHVSNHANDVKK